MDANDPIAEARSRSAARWKRVEDAGALVPVGIHVALGDTDVEIVATYCDNVVTAVQYRPSTDTHVSMSPHSPAFRSFGGSGDRFGDVRISVLDRPIPRDVNELPISLRALGSETQTEPVTIVVPVDRKRTARFERDAGSLPDPIVHDDVLFSVAAASSCLIRAEIEMSIAPTDPTIVGVMLGREPVPIHFQNGPGDPALWRESRPRRPRSPSRATTKTWVDQKGERWSSVSVESKFRATFRKGPPPPRPPDEPPLPEPVREPEAWSVLEDPSGALLDKQGASFGGSEHPDRHRMFVAPPSDDADGIAVQVDRLYAFRFAGGETIEIPYAQRERVVDLSGAVLDTEHGPIELLSWEWRRDFSPALVARPPSPEVSPDLRIMVGEDSSVGFGQPSRYPDGTLRFGLWPMQARGLESASSVRIALRSLGTLAPPVRFPIRLTRPAASSAE